MKSLTVETACLLGIQNEIQAVCQVINRMCCRSGAAWMCMIRNVQRLHADLATEKSQIPLNYTLCLKRGDGASVLPTPRKLWQFSSSL